MWGHKPRRQPRWLSANQVSTHSRRVTQSRTRPAAGGRWSPGLAGCGTATERFPSLPFGVAWRVGACADDAARPSRVAAATSRAGRPCYLAHSAIFDFRVSIQYCSKKVCAVCRKCLMEREQRVWMTFFDFNAIFEKPPISEGFFNLDNENEHLNLAKQLNLFAF